MQPFISGIVLMGFVWLSYFSLHYHPPTKIVSIWRDEKSATIADVFGLTPDEVQKPVRIFTGN